MLQRAFQEGARLCGGTRPVWPASAVHAADGPRLAEARGAESGLPGEPAARRLSQRVLHTGADYAAAQLAQQQAPERRTSWHSWRSRTRARCRRWPRASRSSRTASTGHPPRRWAARRSARPCCNATVPTVRLVRVRVRVLGLGFNATVPTVRVVRVRVRVGVRAGVRVGVRLGLGSGLGSGLGLGLGFGSGLALRARTVCPKGSNLRLAAPRPDPRRAQPSVRAR